MMIVIDTSNDLMIIDLSNDWMKMKNSPYLNQWWSYINGFVQDCNNSIANALELLQSCIKP